MPRGGKRQGAGRPSGSGKFGESTIPIRIPKSMADVVAAYVKNGGYQIPLYSSKVSAGFPSPADDYIEGKLDLNEYLIRTPAATFFVRATGESMLGSGIFPDDLLIVDRSLSPKHGDVVIAILNGELTVKRLHQTSRKTALLPENPKFKEISITEGMELNIWGVVRFVVHPL